MKTFPWLLFLAFELVSILSWPAAELTESVYRREFEGVGFPAVTESVFAMKQWLPLIPLPWCIYSLVLTRRSEVAPSALFTYAGSICLAVSVFLCWVVAGLMLPYLSCHLMLGASGSGGR